MAVKKEFGKESENSNPLINDLKYFILTYLTIPF